MPGSHHRLSPSSSDTWVPCPASVSFTEHLRSRNIIPQQQDDPDPESYSNVGTRAHNVLAKALEYGEVAEEARYRLPKDEAKRTTPEMADYVQIAIDWVADYLEQWPDTDILVETKVNTEPYTGTHDTDGTADIILINKANRELVVFDFKYGSGVAVHVDNTYQLPLYGLGALSEHKESDFKNIKLVICQPRHRDVPNIQALDIPIRKFVKSANRYMSAATKASKPKAFMVKDNFNPGEKQCKWCDAAPHCEALADFMVALAVKEFDADEGGIPGPITQDDLVALPITSPDKRAFIQQHVQLFQTWLTRIVGDNTDYLLRGGKLEGFKLVYTNKNRTYIPNVSVTRLAKAIRLTPADITEEKLLPMTAVEKLAKQTKRHEAFKKFIHKPIGDPIIAPLNDTRDDYIMFDEDEQEDIEDIFS